MEQWQHREIGCRNVSWSPKLGSTAASFTEKIARRFARAVPRAAIIIFGLACIAYRRTSAIELHRILLSSFALLGRRLPIRALREEGRHAHEPHMHYRIFSLVYRRCAAGRSARMETHLMPRVNIITGRGEKLRHAALYCLGICMCCTVSSR